MGCEWWQINGSVLHTLCLVNEPNTGGCGLEFQVGARPGVTIRLNKWVEFEMSFIPQRTCSITAVLTVGFLICYCFYSNSILIINREKCVIVDTVNLCDVYIEGVSSIKLYI